MKDAALQQAFEDLATRARPEPGKWPTIVRRIQRRHRMWIVTSVLASMGLAAGLFAVVASFGGPGDDESLGPIPNTPAVFRDEQNNFQIAIPRGWIFRGQSQGGPSIAMTPPDTEDFSVEVSVRVGTRFDDHTGFGERPFKPIPEIDGATAVRWEELLTERGVTRRRVAYRIDWTGRRALWADERDTCALGQGPTCFGGVATVEFLMTATDEHSWERFLTAAEDAVRSTVTLDDVRPQRWLGTIAFTPWGEIDGGILYDEKVKTLVRYLDAESSGLDVAPQQFLDGPTPPGIEAPYAIVERDDGEPDSPRFTVRFTTTTYVFEVPAEDEVRTVGWPPPPTPGGTVAAGIRDDAHTKLLVRFLEARMAGAGAEDFLCCDAADRARSDAEDRLYRVADFDMIGYRVTDRNAGQSEILGGPYFIVTIVYEDGMQELSNGTFPEEQEFIVVGPEPGSASPLRIIRWAIEGTS